MKRSITGWLVCLTALSIAATSWAVGTRKFELDDGKDFEGGDLEGVAVDSTGRVRAGFTLGNVPVSDATAVWSALPRPDGSVLLGTGNEGKLIQVKGATSKVVAETDALVVTSLAEAWGGAVVLGTLPEGKVMKWERDKLTTLVKLKGAEHVWQVAFDKKSNAVFAATGPEGKLFRITAGGNAQVYFDADEKQLMSVAVAPDGTVYAGASDKAKLYKITGPGRASVLYDFARTEVRAIAVGQKGEVYAVANEIKGGSYAPPKKASASQASATPSSSPPKTSGKGVLYKFEADGSPEELLKNDKEHFTSLAIGDQGKPYVGTGVDGKVYTVDDAHASVLVADTEERMVGALVVAGKNRLVASSDPAVLHPVRGVGGPDAVWTSKVLDAGIRARWGRMTWLSTGALEFSTRSGNTKEPDDTWSAWSQPFAAPTPVTSPAARYLQVRARFSRDPKAELNEVKIPFVTDNLRAMVTEVGTGDSSSSTDGVQASGGPITKKPSPKVELKWKVDNPDKDELRFRVKYRLVGTTQWYDALKPGEKLTKTSYSWDTANLPEGIYRVQVTASDELSNPPDRVKTHVLESSTITVDNTPPTVTGLAAQGRRIRGIAVDGVGPITRIEIAAAGTDDWFPIHPTDGIFDEQREEFDADLSSVLPAGPMLIAVRVYDDANNSVVNSLALK